MKPRKVSKEWGGKAQVSRIDLLYKASPNPPRVGIQNHIRVDVIVGVDGLNSLKHVWDSLIADDKNSSPFLSWDWLQSWIQVYGHKREIVTLVCREDNKIVGIVPFSWKKHPTIFGVRKLWMVGFQSGLGSNGLTEEPIMAIADRSETRARVWSSVHSQLKQMLETGPWDSIAYRKFGNGIEGCSLIESKGKSVIVQQYLRGSEYVQLPKTWEEYVKSISKSMRENIPYYRKKFSKESIDVVIEPVELEDLIAGLDALVALHKKRTYLDKSELHVDYFANPRQRVLLQHALERMIPTGEAQLVVLKANDEIIAAQVFLQNSDTLMAHYCGFDPRWSRFSPLFVLQTSVIRQAIEQGVKTLNLLRGNALWQRRWGAQAVDQIIDITLAKRTILPRVRQVILTQETKVVQKLVNVKPIQRFRASYRLNQIKSNVA